MFERDSHRHRPVRHALLLAAMTAAFLVASEAIAQERQQNCRARPDSETQIPEENTGKSAKDKSKLQECDGILKPPAVGDPELVEPAPDVGRMPVIKPKNLPKQETVPAQTR